MSAITKTAWTQEERDLAVAILEKIAYCQNQGQYLPIDVYEAHLRSKKNISTEVVIFNEKGEVYLVERPTLQENPNEPYPGELHSPGTTHPKNESLEDSLKRLARSEGVTFTNIRQIELAEEPGDVKRGRYLMLIFIADAAGTQTNPKGRFYAIWEIPWERVQITHREIVLPKAFEARTRL